MSIIIALTIITGGAALFCYFSAREEQRRQEWHRRCRISHSKTY